jgi:hypothetical protein
VPVPHPPRLLLPLLVGIKRLFTRSAPPAPAGATVTAAPTAAAPAANPQSSAPGLVQRLGDRYIKMLNFIDDAKRWGRHITKAALADARQFPVGVVVASGPLFSGVIAGWRIARRLGVPFIADFRDPLFAGGRGIVQTGNVGFAIRRIFEKRIVRDAAAITTASPGIAAALSEVYPQHAAKIQVVLNGFDGEPAAAVTDTGGRLNILFAGILYTNRDPFPFLAALEALLADPGVDASRIDVTFVGNCATYRGRSLPEWLAGKRAAAVVKLVPEIRPEELRPYMDAATVLLNFAQGQARLIPAKTFEHLASGREMLVICETDSDTGRLLSGIPGASIVAPGDQPSLEQALRAMYRRHVVEGRSAASSPDDVRRYSRSGQNQLFMRVVDKVG